MLIQKAKNNSLLKDNPKLAEEWHPTKNGSITSNMATANSGKRIWWLGNCGHEWQAAISSRNNRKTGCPYCSIPSKGVLKGFNDLATKNPKLAKEWHPTKNSELEPTDITFCSNRKIWWLGKCGHEWQASINSRVHGTNCPICKNKQVLKNYNDLATVNSKLAEEWHPTKNDDLLPSDITSSAGKKVWWQCACGHEWQARIYSRNYGQGCPVCAKERKSKKC